MSVSLRHSGGLARLRTCKPPLPAMAARSEELPSKHSMAASPLLAGRNTASLWGGQVGRWHQSRLATGLLGSSAS